MHPSMRWMWWVRCDYGEGMKALADGIDHVEAEVKAESLARWAKMRCCTKPPRGVKAKRRCFDYHKKGN